MRGVDTGGRMQTTVCGRRMASSKAGPAKDTEELAKRSSQCCEASNESEAVGCK